MSNGTMHHLVAVGVVAAACAHAERNLNETIGPLKIDGVKNRGTIITPKGDLV